MSRTCTIMLWVYIVPSPSRGSSVGDLQDELTWHFTSFHSSMDGLFPANISPLMSSTHLKVFWLLF